MFQHIITTYTQATVNVFMGLHVEVLCDLGYLRDKAVQTATPTLHLGYLL